MSRAIGFILVLFVAIIPLYACGESTAPTSKDVPGSYHIVALNGKLLPAIVNDSLTIVSSSMVLGSDDSYNETITYSRFGVQSQQTFGGIYSSDGRIVVIEAHGFTFHLYVQDKSTLIENDANGIVIYRKEN